MHCLEGTLPEVRGAGTDPFAMGSSKAVVAVSLG